MSDPVPTENTVKRLLEQGNPEAAFRHVAAALQGAPQNAALWTLLGRLYLTLGQADDATQALRRALALDPRQAAGWQALAAIAMERGRPDAAEAVYREGLAANPDDGALVHGLAFALARQGRQADAAALLRTHLASASTDATAWRLLGELLRDVGDDAGALQAFERSLALRPDQAEVLCNQGLVREAAGDRRGAAAALAAALDQDPACWPALSHLVFLKRQEADWQGLDALSARLCEAGAEGRTGITPFSFLVEPAGPAAQLACARAAARAAEAAAAPLLARLGPLRATPRSGDAPIRVGFVSNGYYNHPTALLMVEMVERLRDSGLETVGFALTPHHENPLSQRLAAAFHEFRNISGSTVAGMTEQLRASRLDLAFDVSGYIKDAVVEPLAARIAPVQVAWMAYPGTSGAGFIDYMLTDRYVVPPAQRPHYSEALVRLPRPYLCFDGTRQVGEPPSRAECGLPEDGLVLVSFNNGYKCTPEVFAAWMRILQGLPGSVLWLLGDPDGEPASRLRAAAASAGIVPERLVFQRKLPHEAYLARYRHADLFLDTWPYNAHTTAGDALWAGCPLLTLPGDTLASRVAGSFLTAMGLHELIATDVGDYVARAIALGRDPARLAALRARVAEPARRAALFDTQAFADDFAAAVRWMVQRQRAGLPPADHDPGAL